MDIEHYGGGVWRGEDGRLRMLVGEPGPEVVDWDDLLAHGWEEIVLEGTINVPIQIDGAELYQRMRKYLLGFYGLGGDGDVGDE